MANRYPGVIEYSQKYDDGVEEFRHVHLPRLVAQKYWGIVGGKLDENLLADLQWRDLGVVMSFGWEHWGVHAKEPHILLFRRSLVKLDAPAKDVSLETPAKHAESKRTRTLACADPSAKIRDKAAHTPEDQFLVPICDRVHQNTVWKHCARSSIAASQPGGEESRVQVPMRCSNISCASRGKTSQRRGKPRWDKHPITKNTLCHKCYLREFKGLSSGGHLHSMKEKGQGQIQ